METTKDPEIYKCNLCNSTFYKKRYLTKHIYRHSNNAKQQNEVNAAINSIECREDNCIEKFKHLQ